MTPSRKAGGIPRVSTEFSLGAENKRADPGMGRRSLSRETKFLGANGDREINIHFPCCSGDHEAGLATV